MKLSLFFLLIPMVIFCDEWQSICARDGQLMYRIKVPNGWERQSSPTGEQLADTKQANCSFTYDEIRVTIHTFPSNTIDERIPPMSQINRWKQQFEKIEPASIEIIPQSYSGYVGFLFEGTGILKGKPTTMLAWSMQLVPEHYRTLQYDKPKEMRADFTIKAVGPIERMRLYRNTLITFARTFELIDEIPPKGE